MSLSVLPSFPSNRHYVLKLHRDASPHADRIAGRLINMASGRQFDFRNAEQLLAQLAADLASNVAETHQR